jgi:hypothetical protein
MPMVPSDFLAAARLLARLPGFLRRPIGAEQARRELTRRLETRGATFVDLVRRAIYARPASPYARLLRHAGCAPGDLERLVRAGGVEGALQALLSAGVGPVDSRTLVEAFLATLGPPGGTAGIMATLWRNAGLLAVERRAPRATRSGKVLHLHRAEQGAWRARSS